MTLQELAYGPLCSDLSLTDRALLLVEAIDEIEIEKTEEIKELEEQVDEQQADVEARSDEAKQLRDQLDTLCKAFEAALKNDNVETVGLLIIASSERITAHKHLDSEVKRARSTIKLYDDGELSK